MRKSSSNITYPSDLQMLIGGAGMDRARAVAKSYDDQYIYLGGLQRSFQNAINAGSGNDMVVVVKLSLNLQIEWVRSFAVSATAYDHEVVSLTATPDGGVVFLTTHSTSPTTYVLTKLDSAGNVVNVVQTTTALPASYGEVLSDGSLIFSGAGMHWKLSSTLATQWYFTEGKTTSGGTIKIGSDGSIYKAQLNAAGATQYIISKFNSTGAYVSNKYVIGGATSANNAQAVPTLIDASDNLYLAVSFFDSASNIVCGVIKVNSAGTALWCGGIVTGFAAMPIGIVWDKNNNIHAAYVSSSAVHYIKLDSSGTLLWQYKHTIGAAASAWAFSASSYWTQGITYSSKSDCVYYLAYLGVTSSSGFGGIDMTVGAYNATTGLSKSRTAAQLSTSAYTAWTSLNVTSGTGTQSATSSSITTSTTDPYSAITCNFSTAPYNENTSLSSTSQTILADVNTVLTTSAVTVTEATVTGGSITCPTGGEVSINGGAFSSTATVFKNDSIVFRITSQSTYDNTTNFTWTVIDVNFVLTVDTTASATFSSSSYNTQNVTQNFTVPTGVTSISILVSGPSGCGYQPIIANSAAGAGGGGALSYTNNIAVTPGEVLTILPGTATGMNSGQGGTAPSSEIAFVKRGATILVSADYGRPGQGSTGGVGGLAANGVGSVKFSGGTGGSSSNPNSGNGGDHATLAANGANGGTIARTYGNVGKGIVLNATDWAVNTNSGGGGDGSYNGTGMGNGASGKVKILWRGRIFSSSNTY